VLNTTLIHTWKLGERKEAIIIIIFSGRFHSVDVGLGDKD
jgi:hypothetical protein